MKFYSLNFYLFFATVILGICVTTCIGRRNHTRKRYIMMYEEVGPETQFDVRRMKPGTQQNPVMYYDSGLGARHHDVIVYNFGRHQFLAETCYASHVTRWTGYTDGYIDPNVTRRLSMEGTFFLTKLQMNGLSEGTGLAYVYRGNEPTGHTSYDVQEPFTLNINPLKVLRRFSSKAAMKFIPNPFGSIALSTIIDTFFGGGEEDPWEQVKDRVEARIEHQKTVIIAAILDNDLKPLKAKIERIQKSKKSNSHKIARKILNVVDIMVGFENKFVFSAQGLDNEKINYNILPLYTQLINMKLAFYSWCISFPKKLGLDEEDMEDIQYERDTVIKKAKEYINKMYADRDHYAYEECPTWEIYNCVMEIRTYLGIHGLEYIPYWDAIKQGKDPQDDIPMSTVSYSNYFGRSTILLYQQIFIEFGNPPLTPALKEDKSRTKLIAIIVHYGNGDKIVGITVYFDDDTDYLMGDPGDNTKTIRMNEAQLEKMDIGGDGDVSNIIFYLSDGREERHGTNFGRGYSATFQMENHFISSFFVANDAAKNGGKLANIACSFMSKTNISLTMPEELEQEAEDDSSE